MHIRRIVPPILAVVAMLTTLLSASPALAGDGNNGKGNGGGNASQSLKDKIALVQKQKTAAANLKALKAKLGDTTTATVTLKDPQTGYMLTDYFGVANWANSPALTKFKDKLPQLGPGGANALGQYIPVAVADNTTYLGSDYYEIAVVEYQEQLHSDLPPTTLRGYVQLSTTKVPGAKIPLYNLDKSPIMMPDGITQALAVDKPHYLGPVIVATGSPKAGDPGTPVRIKFYNLLPAGVDGNLFIPVDTTVMGAGMGPLMGPGNVPVNYTQNRATVHLHGNNSVWLSDGTPHQWITPADETTPYPKGVSVSPIPDMPDPGPGAMTIFYSNAQSARLQFYHDHAFGITRLNVYAGEAAGYVITDAVEQDLINGTNLSGVNPGSIKVLPDIGIPLIIQDKTFVDPVSINATDPTWLDPLQKTFGTSHRSWSTSANGTPIAGDLWYPHVYMPAQNPEDITGTNPYGRWMYGPWFYPPTANIDFPPVANEYYQTDPTLANYAPWEPEFRPATPNPSMPGEAFMDTMLVNGTVYPYVEVQPKAYRFRVLNASNDRFLNLSLYQANKGIVGSLTTTTGDNYTADPVVTVTNAPGDTTGKGFTLYATANATGQIEFAIRTVGSNYTLPPDIRVTNAPGDNTGIGASATAVLYGGGVGQLTEVGMVPVTGTNWLPPFDASGVPDQSMAGPSWIQIGTEGGFLPAPVVIDPRPITWNTNPTTFNFGTVNGHSLLLAPAERSDVIVDFSAYAGKTLILYNDAPAAFPAPVPTYDYYTNNQDLTANGGAPTTPPGVGPNTRTIMQINVAAAPVAAAYNVNTLNSIWAKGNLASGNPTKRGVFEVSQDPIIVPQAAYNSAYGKTGTINDTFPTAPATQYVQVNQYSKTINPIDAAGKIQANPVTLPIQLKGAHDEMGGVYDTGYGRMSGMLGLEKPATTAQLAQFIPYGYEAPPVEIMTGSVAGTLVGSLDDGTQIWNIIHNGVDSHPIHVHLFNVQLINRVGWDGIMLPPDPNELGWKETFRMNPLEQVIVALRPTLPTAAQIPFIDQVPNSVRLLNPALPEGALLDQPPPAGWFDPNGVTINSVTNHYVNFGWEYVYHCHILAHEEMDMMHGMAFAIPPNAPSSLVSTVTGSGGSRSVVLTWTDNSVNNTGFTVQRATNVTFTNELTTFLVGPNVATYTDRVGNSNKTFYYRVFASNVVGDVATPGFPVVTAKSGFTNIAPYPANAPLIAPTAPSNVTATAVRQGGNARVTLTWSDNSNNEAGFAIQRATDPNFTFNVVTSTVGAGVTTFTTGNIARGANFYFRVQAFNSANPSAWVNANPSPILTP